MTKLEEYLRDADPKDLQDCLVENFHKHDSSYYRMLSEIYYNDKAHFNQLSSACKAAMLLYLAYCNSREIVVEAFDKMLEDC